LARIGDIIKWTNFDIIPHTATAKDQSWDTEALETGQSLQVTVTDNMSGDYFCALHPHMKATLRIR
jgi:plastocyanin